MKIHSVENMLYDTHTREFTIDLLSSSGSLRLQLDSDQAVAFVKMLNRFQLPNEAVSSEADASLIESVILKFP